MRSKTEQSILGETLRSKFVPEEPVSPKKPLTNIKGKINLRKAAEGEVADPANNGTSSLLLPAHPHHWYYCQILLVLKL